MEPLIVPGKLDSLEKIRKYTMQVAEDAGIEKKRVYKLRLAVDEIATNIIIHGYGDAGITGDVKVQADVDDDSLTVTLEDTSAPFDPRRFARPDHMDKPMGERPIGGLGVYLAMVNVDQFNYEFVDGKNRNTFIVKRPSDRATTSN